MSPSARSLNALRKAGWIACTVERWIAQRGIRVDCFHFADLLAAHPVERRILLVQATSLANVSARVEKIQGKSEASAWLASGGEVEVWGWALHEGRWRAKIVRIRAGDMAPVTVAAIPRKRRKRRDKWQSSELF